MRKQLINNRLYWIRSMKWNIRYRNYVAELLIKCVLEPNKQKEEKENKWYVRFITKRNNRKSNFVLEKLDKINKVLDDVEGMNNTFYGDNKW